MQLHQGKLTLCNLDRIEQIPQILEWVDTWANDTTVIAIDAPTLIPNATGMRLPDRLTHRYFGKYHAGCYPANLGRPFAERTVSFSEALVNRGFHHAPHINPQAPGKYQIEVFPHPAMIHLFGLDRILKYKKGKLADRRQELERLRDLLQTHLPLCSPALSFAEPLPSIPQTGKELKELEDMLDGLVCAYVAAHWWWWGNDRNWTLGSLEDGFIIVPAPTQGSIIAREELYQQSKKKAIPKNDKGQPT